MDIAERRSRIVGTHPCLSAAAHGRFSRIHMPIAPACNIQCNYCIRKFDCVSESRPGVASRVLGAREAVERLSIIMERARGLSVVGIAGPGDPLANDATFEFLRAASSEFPSLTYCLSTNGLLLPERLDELVACGVSSLTVTINAVSASVASGIYGHAHYRGRTLRGPEAAELLLANQWRGAREAVRAGLILKVNTICIPGVNDREIPEVAQRAETLGAEIMNIMPLIPQAGFAHLRRPSRKEIEGLREVCSVHVPQMRHCRQCRADAFGLLGQDGDAELEVLHAGIGEDYCESVY
jgi:nitrogen fixation protein NifB